MTAQEVETMRKERPRDFDAAVAELVHGAKRYKSASDAKESLYILADNYGTLAVFCNSPWSPYSDADADHQTFAHIKSTWPKRKRGEFHIACREIWEARGYLGSDPWQMYQIGDYSAAALWVAGMVPA